MTRERKTFRPLTSENICNIYKLLHSEGLVSFPYAVESLKKVDSLVANINSVYFGEEIYKLPEEKMVAYLFFLIKNHPFVDGNKRTACLAFGIVCDLNDLEPRYEGFTLDELAVLLEKIRVKDHQQLIRDVAVLLFGK